MPTYSTCIFCNRDDSPPSREHILATWITEAFPEVEAFRIEEERSGRSYESVGHLGLISRRACLRCNTTWMAKLESTVKPILLPLMSGNSVTLTEEQQLVIARWFLKTIMMLETLRRETHFFSNSERHMFCESLDVPKLTTLIFLARYVGSFNVRAEDWLMGLLVGPDTAKPFQVDCYTATLIIKQLAAQIFTVRLPEEQNFGIRFRLRGDWEAASIRIWPINGTTIWPPSQAFDDAIIDVFIKRFGTAEP